MHHVGMKKIKIKGKTYTYADFYARMKGKNPEWVRSKTQKKLEEIRKRDQASFWNVKTKENLILGDGLTGVTHVFNKGGSRSFKNRESAKDYIRKKLMKRKY